MANHKSSEKRIRQTAARKILNKYYAKTMRNAIKKLRNTEVKSDAETMYPKVVSLIDRLAKRNVIHDNKASNLKSRLAIHINKM